MKVTVCFGSIRIVVPCGTGELLVRDLINESIRRYRKATAKDQDAWVIVHHLQTQSGILDPDDRVNDVADDREQILASFEDSGPDPGVQQGGGDGASGSSVGTNSPDIFRGVPEIKYVVENITDSNNNVNTNSNNNNIISNTNSTNNGTNINNNANNNNITPHIEVTVTATNQQTQSGLGLQVRRSSDPSIHQIELPSDSRNLLLNNNVKQVTHQQDPTKRWSAAPVCRDAAVPDQLSQPQLLLTKPLIYSDKLMVNGAGNNGLINENGINIQRKNIHYLSPSWENEESQQQLDDDGSQPMHAGGTSLAHSPFSRSGRLSMQFLGGDGYKWMDAADKLMAPNTVGTSSTTTTTTTTNNGSGITTNPLLTAYNSKSLPRDTKQRKEPLGQAAYESMRCEKSSSSSSKFGEMLLIINEYGGPLGLTAIPDEKNGGLLVQSVEIGSCAERGRLRRGDRILEINGQKLIGLAEQSVLEHLKRNCTASELRVRVIRSNLMNGNAINSGSGDGNHVQLVQRLKKEIIEMQEAEEKTSQTKVATVSPTRKMPGQSVTSGTVALQTANTRKLGRKIEISLKKGLQGLGFSVTTRDNPAGGHCPIYIKTILPRGAAIEDGRLRPGDRLLEVDGVTMTGKSQSEVVGILRSTQSGATVNIVVSRQQESTEAEREIGFNGHHEHNDVMNDDNTTPPKPPPPILPQKSNFNIKPNGILKEKNLNDKNFIETDGKDDSIPYENPQQITSSPTISAHSTNSWRNREILTLHIPVHDTEKAGLGVSVKGKTGSPNSSNGSNNSSTGKQHDGDLGIFVKSVLHGGAASRDGRLKTNDQLLNVNGISLLGQSNAEAMETLRKAMVHTGGKYPGMITLTVSRRIRQNSNSSNKMNNSNNNHNLINGQIDTYDFSNHSNSSSTTASEQSGKTVIYLSSATDNKQNEQKTTTNVGIKNNHNLTNNNYNTNVSMDTTNTKRWSNPVLDRLTGGTGHLLPSMMQSTNSRTLPTHMTQHNGGLRNESYYIATNDNWSPNIIFNGNNSVLIEEDPEPASPTIKLAMNRMYDNNNNKQQPSSTQQMPSSPTVTSTSTTSTNGNCDITYSSQLSLETNPPNDAFSRDAIGRRSMSEKHHAALDAKETGTYQRNKKLREEREREKHVGSGNTKQHYPMNSMDSLINTSSSNNNNFNMHTTHNHLLNDLNLEAMDRVGDLGPSLGLKKSSSLESLQTMVQELQMSDEPRGPIALRAPRGRGREDSLRAAVERPPTENKPRKHWLLEDGPSDTEGGFINRHGPFQGSLNEGKPKHRHKKPSILKGIGHMFRFGKHRKDGVCPTEAFSDIGGHHQQHPPPHHHESNSHKTNTIHSHGHGGSLNDREKPPGGTPNYQPPAAPTTLQNGNINNSSNGISGLNSNNGNNNNAIHHNDIFNHRYSHYVNYDELQQHLSPQIERLSETTIAQMRLQVMQQRVKVEEESRRHQHYHSQRSTSSSSKSNHLNEFNTAQSQPPPPQQAQQQQQLQSHQSNHHQHPHQQRPISSYYEYETIQQSVKKYIAPSPPTNKWNGNIGGSGRLLPSSSTSSSTSSTNNHHRNGGPFVTQITIRDQQHQIQKQQQQPQHHQHHQIGQQPASKV